MAIEHIRATLNAELKELDTWAGLGAATDFPSEPAKGAEDLVRRAYVAFNDRQIDAGMALMDPNVDWPNIPQGGFVHGREQVRKHWSEQFSQVDPRIEIDDVMQKGDGCVEAHVRQIVRSLDGKTLSDDPATQVFTIANNRIVRMEVRPA
jgi:hypothetical protein